VKEWNGLLKKEWLTMKGQFLATIVASILFIVMIPFGSNLLNFGLDTMQVSLIMSLIWMVISMFIPAIILLISLGKEMRHPDIWLHSKASIYKMFGSKAVFVLLVGVLNLAIPLVSIIIGSRFSNYSFELTFKMAIQVSGLLFVPFFLTSLLIMCTGLFFGVVYQLIKPKVFAVPIVILLFLGSSWVTERISATDFYKELTSFWAIKGPGKEIIDIAKDNTYIEIDTAILYGGDLLVGLLYAALLFIIAVTLFEKKVSV